MFPPRKSLVSDIPARDGNVTFFYGVQRVNNYIHTVKSSNFVILFGEKIFFCLTLFWLPHNFFWYWSLYSMGLGIDQSHFSLSQWLCLENWFFHRVTKLEDSLLNSSPSQVKIGAMAKSDRGCKDRHCFLYNKILWTHMKQMTPSMGL